MVTDDLMRFFERHREFGGLAARKRRKAINREIIFFDLIADRCERIEHRHVRGAKRDLLHELFQERHNGWNEFVFGWGKER